MGDFYKYGFEDGYGTKHYGDREFPENDGDRYSYEQGMEDGQRRKKIAEELTEEGY